MGLLDLLKRKSPVERAQKDLCEPYAQPDVRRAAMATLLDLGTEEAYGALLKRFNFNAHGHIADESEKRDLLQELIDVGQPVLPALERFIQTEKAIVFPIRALVKIRPKADALEFLCKALEAKEPLDHRTTDSKRALVIAIGDLGSTEHAKRLAPYLDDHHDDVQMQVIESMERLADPETASDLARVCGSELHASRVQQRAAQSLSTLGWPVKDSYAGFAKEVRDEFVLDKKGVLVRKNTKPRSED
jgi:hypothetical protein